MGIVVKSLFFVLVLLAGLGGIAYWLTVQDKLPLDDAARADAAGEFVRLTDGDIHYRWFEPEDDAADAPVIVMAHGFSTPNFIFEQNAEALASEGFRVLTFDHFGRGWSDRPEGPYSVDFYDRELLELADAMELDEPFGLVGLSMGGVIVAEFAARHPERVSKLGLLVPAGLTLGTEAGSFNDRLLTTPVLGEWVWTVFGEQLLLGDDQYDESTLRPHERLAGDVSIQMAYEGYFSALLSSYRHNPMRDRDETFQRVNEIGVPVVAIFGDADTTVLPASEKRLKAAIPDSETHMIEGGDHGLNYKMAGAVNPILIDFFSEITLTDTAAQTSLREN
ncbi:MAG: alpha/beta hydrolase [Pseudomonadota bacterium]